MHFHSASRIATFALALAAGPALAAATDVTPQSFVVTHRAETSASPAAVFAAFGQVSRWWGSQHTYSGKAENLSLEMRAGGCWCEQWDGGSVQHGRVIFAQPQKMLRLQAALGPLQGMAVTGVLSFTLAPDGPGTRVTMTYRVAGALTMETAKLAPLVDQVMGVQLHRLGNYASRRPVGP